MARNRKKGRRESGTRKTGYLFKRKLNGRGRRKLAGLFLAVVLALVCLLIRITYINATSGEDYTRQVLSNSQAKYGSSAIAYRRGDILDAKGTLLATSEKRYNVILDCYILNYDADYREPTEEALKEVFSIDPSAVDQLLDGETTADSRYQVLLKNVSVEDKKAFNALQEVTDDMDETERTRRKNIRGIWFEDEYVRTYPMGTLASHVLGFTYDTDKADWGIESYYNNTLSGVDGRKYGYWGSGDDLEQTIVEPTDGENVQLTLDANIQSICESVISDFNTALATGPYYTDRGANEVAVIIQDPNTGAILAMASSDPYDPNNPRDLTGFYPENQLSAMSEEQKTEALEGVWRNYCISDSYEPGSVFKPVVMASALEDGTLKGDETFVCDGYQIIGSTRIKCSNPNGHGEETLSDIIMNSCNDGMMQIASLMGIDDFCAWQRGFGFGQRTGIDLSGEASGIIGDADSMGNVDLATSAFGQGFTCTMVQESSAISAVINGGYYMKPHLMDRVTTADGAVTRTYGTVLQKEIISEDVSDMVRSYMKASVDSGTSQYAKVDGYSMGGKTGTAQKIPRGNGKYLCSFTGFAPYEDPQVLIYVIVDEVNVKDQADSRFAQWIARDILQQVLPYLEIYPDEALNPDNVYLTYDYANPSGTAETDTQADTNVPDVTGAETENGTDGGNTEQTDGVTNEDAGLA